MQKKTPEINFLQKQRAILTMQSKRLHIIHTFSLVTLVAYIIVILSLLSYSAYLKFSFNQITKKITSEKKAIEQMSETKAKYYAIKKKTQSIMGVSKSLYEHQSVIEMVMNLVPKGMTMKGLKIDENEINFSISTFDSEMIPQFFSNVERVRTSDTVSVTSADIGGIRVSEDGSYSFAVKLEIKNNTI
jgi:Tfp pilus assembly protein PilN